MPAKKSHRNQTILLALALVVPKPAFGQNPWWEVPAAGAGALTAAGLAIAAEMKPALFDAAKIRTTAAGKSSITASVRERYQSDTRTVAEVLIHHYLMGPYVLSHELNVLADRYPAGASALDALKVDIINVCNQIKPSNCPQLATQSSPMIIHPGGVENGAGGESAGAGVSKSNGGQIAASGSPDPEEYPEKAADPSAGNRYLNNPNQLEGRTASSVEEEFDTNLVENGGWQKGVSKDGNGIRYIDGKGHAFIVNKGYPEGLAGGGGDAVHSGPYVKLSPTIRVPLSPG